MSEQKQENTTNSTTETKHEHIRTTPKYTVSSTKELLESHLCACPDCPCEDIEIKFQTKTLENERKNYKANGLEMINNCLTTFTKTIDKGITFSSIDALNIMIYETLSYLDIKLSDIIAYDDNSIYLNKEMTELNTNNLTPVYELVLWKRINDQIEDQPKYGIIDNINFLRDIKDYINNVCYKNIDVE